MLKDLDHIGIVVENLEDALRQYTTLFGFSLQEVAEHPGQGMRIGSVKLGSLVVELMESTSRSGVLTSFREKRGTGVHHLAYRVRDLRAALRHVQDAGIRVVDKPHAGGGGNVIAFLHPKDTGGVLMELCQPEDGGTP